MEETEDFKISQWVRKEKRSGPYLHFKINAGEGNHDSSKKLINVLLVSIKDMEASYATRFLTFELRILFELNLCFISKCTVRNKQKNKILSSTFKHWSWLIKSNFFNQMNLIKGKWAFVLRMSQIAISRLIWTGTRK